MLTTCTLTGLDESTDRGRWLRLATEHAFSEWGLLYSSARQGASDASGDIRYPSQAFIEHTLQSAPSQVRLAVHFCGQAVHDLLHASYHAPAYGLLLKLQDRSRHLGRTGCAVAQLNLNMQSSTPVNVQSLIELMRRHPTVFFITQDNKNNAELREVLRGVPNHGLLFDASGGRGLAMTHVPEALSHVDCGYAGGLGPDNIQDKMPRIAQAARDRSFWVDMEQSLRVQGRFNLDACRTVLDQCLPWVEPTASSDVDPARGEDLRGRDATMG